MKLIRALTKDQHTQILTAYPDDSLAAEKYTEVIGAPVSRQLVRYWRKIMATNKPQADAELIRKRILRTPSPTDDVGDLSWVPEVSKRLLVSVTYTPHMNILIH